MTKTSTPPAVPSALRDGLAGMPATPWMPAVPWELVTQTLTLQSALWMAVATLQAQWLSESVETLGRMPGWAIWHNGLEQLA